MRSDPRCVVHAKEKEKKEKKAIRPEGVTKRNTRWRAEARESHSAIVRKTQVRALGGAIRRDREKHSEGVREWKRKIRLFFFAQVIHKEDKLMEFLWSFRVLQPWRVVLRRRFYYWLCGEIVFTRNLFIVYLIYCGLKFSINLIVVISILVDIFWSCPVVFPSTLEGFPCKIWCSCVVVFMWCLMNFFFPIILLLLGSYIF